MLDSVRQHSAEALLRDARVSLADAAFLLGYTEQQLNKAGWKDADLEKPPG